MKHQFQHAGKTITVYPAEAGNCPAVYLNTFAKDGDDIYRLLSQSQGPAFTLVTIGGLNWDHDMAPWDIPPVSRFDTPCTGGADDYLKCLTEEIVPQAEALIPGGVAWRGLAGYSLAGLFAVYALYQAETFSRIASMSGSLWFPGFIEYVSAHEMIAHPTHAYFSLGDKEGRTKNPYMKTVQEDTEQIKNLYQRRGVDTLFELNRGGHFKQTAARTAAGITWLLSRPSE